MIELAEEFKKISKLDVGVIAVRCVKPLNTKALDEINSKVVVTLEENALIGGFGSMVSSYYAEKNKDIIVKQLGVKDEFVKNGSILKQMEFNGLTIENLTKLLENIYN